MKRKTKDIIYALLFIGLLCIGIGIPLYLAVKHPEILHREFEDETEDDERYDPLDPTKPWFPHIPPW